MSKKPGKHKSNSSLKWGLSIVLLGIVFFAFSNHFSNFFQSSKKLKSPETAGVLNVETSLEVSPESEVSSVYSFRVGYLYKAIKRRVELMIPDIEREFAKNSLKIKVFLEPPPPVVKNMQGEKLGWDFALTNITFILMQKREGARIGTLLLHTKCKHNAIAHHNENQSGNISSYKNKKVMIYGFGYPSAVTLKAVNDWGLSGADLSITNDRAWALTALENGVVDLLISDVVIEDSGKVVTSMYANESDYAWMKTAKISDYAIPCRAIAYDEDLPQEALSAFSKTFLTSRNDFLTNYELATKEKINKIEKKFDWKKFLEIESKLKISNSPDRAPSQPEI